MARQQLSVPVSLMLIVIGAAVAYFVLHSHGWRLSGPVTLVELFPTLSITLRAVVVAGIVAAGWGTGSLFNTLVRQK
jgi:hypothetical protein